MLAVLVDPRTSRLEFEGDGARVRTVSVVPLVVNSASNDIFLSLPGLRIHGWWSKGQVLGGFWVSDSWVVTVGIRAMSSEIYNRWAVFSKIQVGAAVGLLLLQCHVRGECGPWLARAGGTFDDGVAGGGLPCEEDICIQVRCGALGRRWMCFQLHVFSLWMRESVCGVVFIGAGLLSVGPMEEGPYCRGLRRGGDLSTVLFIAGRPRTEDLVCRVLLCAITACGRSSPLPVVTAGGSYRRWGWVPYWASFVKLIPPLLRSRLEFEGAGARVRTISVVPLVVSSVNN
ncbi:hypothetical protein Taro_047810, partial [Colocasia esculenta]|nr:hypothetical protein [Colocasia esculenta]